MTERPEFPDPKASTAPAAVVSRRWAVPAMSVAFLLLLVMTWVVSDLAVHRVGPDLTAAGRSFFSTLGMCLLVARGKGAARRSVAMIRDHPGAMIISGLLGVALYALSSLQSIALVGISIPNLLLATTPCVSLIIGVAWFGKTGSRAAFAGVVVATIGAVIYVLSSFTLGRDVSTRVLLAGVGAGIVAVLAIAVYGQYYARISAGHDPLDLLPGIFGAGTIAVLIFLAVTGRLSAVTSVDLPGWGLLILLGVVIYVPVYVLQHQLIHTRGAVFMAAISLGTPFLVRAAEILFLDGSGVDVGSVVGMVICVVGVYLVVRNPLTDRVGALRNDPSTAPSGGDRDPGNLREPG